MGKLKIILVLFILSTLQGCGLYSFTGTSIAPDIKTVSVDFFPNRATLVQPTLSQSFTEALKEIFLSQTSLALVDRDGDVQFEGYISDYNTISTAVQADQTSALNRLTITVKVKYTNTKNDSKSFEQSFSNFADYAAGENLSAVEEDLISEINEKLTQAIFNKSLGDW